LNSASIDENTRLRLTYQVIKKATKFHPALPIIREYKAKYIQSQMLEVHARDWEIALFLPTEQFRKKGPQTIWAQTREEIREQPRRAARAAQRRRDAQIEQSQKKTTEPTP
jgi:hypothetical protein